MRQLIATLTLITALPCASAWASDAAVRGDGFTRHLADLINGYRQSHGLQALDIAEDLAQLAHEHSSSMAQQRQLTHEGFRTRFRRSGSKACVENVGWNHPTAESLLDGWRHSPAHHRNLLEAKVSRMGIAASTRYVTFFACR